MGCACLEPIRCDCGAFAEYIGTRGYFDVYRCPVEGYYILKPCELQKEVTKRHE